LGLPSLHALTATEPAAATPVSAPGFEGRQASRTKVAQLRTAGVGGGGGGGDDGGEGFGASLPVRVREALWQGKAACCNNVWVLLIRHACCVKCVRRA